MSDSIKKLNRVTREILQQRMRTVKELRQSGTDTYEILKDTETGEHFLLYYYEHVLLSDQGHKETYYHLMPLESDDVLGMIAGEDAFDYPDSWNRPFLRNSSQDDSYVWFDPAHQAHFEQNEEIAAALKRKLAEFKKSGSRDENSIKKLFEDLDQL